MNNKLKAQRRKKEMKKENVAPILTVTHDLNAKTESIRLWVAKMFPDLLGPWIAVLVEWNSDVRSRESTAAAQQDLIGLSQITERNEAGKTTDYVHKKHVTGIRYTLILFGKGYVTSLRLSDTRDKCEIWKLSAKLLGNNLAGIKDLHIYEL